jgi:co-chaperonin GroES (HSP10)
MLPETKTKGGIHLPEKAQGKVLEASVVAVGPGERTQDGRVLPIDLKPGDKVFKFSSRIDNNLMPSCFLYFINIAL